jgi:hypothetical protein
MKTEGGRMNDERMIAQAEWSLFHPASFRLHPCSQREGMER